MRARVSPRAFFMDDAPTQAALFKQLGVSRKTVNAWRKRPDWTFGEPPWSAAVVRAIDRWRKTQLQENRAETERASKDDPEVLAQRKAKIERDIEAARKTRLQNEILEGRYIKAEQHDRTVVGFINLFKSKCSDLIESLPPLCEGKKASEIRILFRSAYDRIFVDLTDQAMMQLAEPAQVEQLRNAAKAKAAATRHHG